MMSSWFMSLRSYGRNCNWRNKATATIQFPRDTARSGLPQIRMLRKPVPCTNKSDTKTTTHCRRSFRHKIAASHHAHRSKLYPTKDKELSEVDETKNRPATEKMELGVRANKLPRFEKYECWQPHSKQQQDTNARYQRQDMGRVETRQTQVSNQILSSFHDGVVASGHCSKQSGCAQSK